MRLTVDSIKKITTLWRQGCGVEEISKTVGLNEKDVVQLLTQIKITTQKGKNQEKVKKIEARVLIGEKLEDIAEEENESVANVAATARYMQKQGKVESVQSSTMDEDAVSTTGYRRLIEAAAQLQTALREVDPTQREVSIRCDTDKPIMVVAMSDWHLGSIHTDMHKILEVVDFIKGTPNVYCLFGGDVFDSVGASSKHLSITHEALLQPSVVRRIAQGIFHDLDDKLLAFVAGCHDTWLQDATDLDQVAEFSNSPYLGHGGAVNLWVGEQVYRIGLRHKFTGGTTQSIFNTNKNYLLRVDATADVVIIGHHHVSGVASEVWQGKERLYVRTGSAKQIDRYASQLGLAPVREGELKCGFPAFILYPENRKMQGFSDWEDASQVFKSI